MQVTMTGPPTTQRWELPSRDGSRHDFDGVHLGHGSSQHPGKERWFEVDLYRETNGVFVVYTRGMSTVIGESTRVRLTRTGSAYEVLELLTVNHNAKLYLPRQSSRALSQAAQWDDDIRDAYINRAVT